MRTILFILASTASLVMVDPARPQYVPPTLGQDAPGYNWREQRAQDDWRNNTWREDREQNDWRNNTWREQRANEDWQQHEDYTKDRTKNNATDRGYVECGVGSVGSSSPCPKRRSRHVDDDDDE